LAKRKGRGSWQKNLETKWGVIVKKIKREKTQQERFFDKALTLGETPPGE